MNIDPLNAKLDVNLRVADLGLSRDWYARVFGVEPIYQGVDRSVDGEATPMVCFRLGGVKFWLLPKDKTAAATHAPQSVGLAFMTAQPLAPLRKELEGRGASFDDTPTPGFPIDAHGVRIGKDAEFIWMVDPDGYHLEFCRVFEFRK